MVFSWVRISGSLICLAIALYALTDGTFTKIATSHTIIALAAVLLPCILLALCLSLLFGISSVQTLKFFSLPIGLLVSLIFAETGGSAQNSEYFLGSLSAAIAGGFLTLYGYGSTASQTSFRASNVQVALFGLTAVFLPQIICFWALEDLDLYLGLFSSQELSVALDLFLGLHYPHWTPVLLTFVAIYLIQFQDSSMLEKAQVAGCYGLIFVTALSVLQVMQDFLWFLDGSAVVLTYDDLGERYATPGEVYVMSASVSLAKLIHMLQIYIVIVVASIMKGETNSLGIRNWHLSEAYIFLTFMLLAPQSLLEVLGESETFEPVSYVSELDKRSLEEQASLKKCLGTKRAKREPVGELAVIFENLNGKPVELIWANENGRLEVLGRIEADESVDWEIYEGDPILFVDIESGLCVGTWTAPEGHAHEVKVQICDTCQY